MHVSGIHARPRLTILPPVLARVPFRAVWRAQSVGVARHQLASMNRRVMQVIVVAPWRVRGALETDHATKLTGEIGRELEDDRAPHRATDDDRPLEAEE